MATPADADQVISALRLGWAVSEVRGRERPGQKLTVVAPLTGQLRADHALPLGGERSEREQLIEAEAVVAALAGRLELNVDSGELSGQSGRGKKPASRRLRELAQALTDARELPEGPGAAEQLDRAWNDFAAFLYDWDAKMQDLLAGGAFSVASGYQLGRGLAEIAWLDPSRSASDEATSWEFTLGQKRVETLKRLVNRLGDYFYPLTGPAVAHSLDVWQSAASNAAPGERDDMRNALIDQTRRWRDLLLTGLDPTTLLPPNRFLQRASQARSVLRSFWPELLIGGLFAVAAALGAAWLASASNHRGWAALVSVLGVFGVTTSTLLAKAKNEAHALIGQLQTALDADLVREAVTIAPRPKARPSWHFW